MKVAAALCLVLVAAGCGTTKTVTVTNTVTKTVTTTERAPAACTRTDLSGSFDEQVGSAGAGQITYVLKLTNSSANACELTITGLQLLDAKGSDVWTHATPPATTTDLGAGASVSYEVRFSPDVAGTGDSQTGACEPVASTLRVTVGGDTVDAPIKPPTSVCEQGSMTLRAG